MDQSECFSHSIFIKISDPLHGRSGSSQIHCLEAQIHFLSLSNWTRPQTPVKDQSNCKKPPQSASYLGAGWGGGFYTVRSNALWVMVTWGSPCWHTDWQTHMTETLPFRNFISGCYTGEQTQHWSLFGTYIAKKDGHGRLKLFEHETHFGKSSGHLNFYNKILTKHTAVK